MSEAREWSLQELKQQLVIALILAISSSSRAYVIYSDAYDQGLDCVLMQYRNVIAYALWKQKTYK